jgi:hypothetical protein
MCVGELDFSLIVEAQAIRIDDKSLAAHATNLCAKQLAQAIQGLARMPHNLSA